MFWFKAEHPETGEELEVSALVYGEMRGLRDSYGAPLEPDELPELVICDVWDASGRAVSYDSYEAALIATGWRELRRV
jgi:hypothetical protein